MNNTAPKYMCWSQHHIVIKSSQIGQISTRQYFYYSIIAVFTSFSVILRYVSNSIKISRDVMARDYSTAVVILFCFTVCNFCFLFLLLKVTCERICSWTGFRPPNSDSTRTTESCWRGLSINQRKSHDFFNPLNKKKHTERVVSRPRTYLKLKSRRLFRLVFL